MASTIPYWAVDTADVATEEPPSPSDVMSRISIIPQPSNQPSMFSSGMGNTVPPSENPDWAMTQAIALDPKGFVKAIPETVMTPFSVAGKMLGAAAADVGTTISGHPEYGGNLGEFFNRTSPAESAQPTPQQETLAQVSKTNPVIATASKVASGLVETAPLIFASVEGLAGKLIALGFSADMISKAPQLARDLGDELGKPVEQRDQDRLTTLVADAIQTGVFAPLAGAHGLGEIPGKFSSAFDTINRTLPRPPIERTTNAETIRSEQPLQARQEPQTPAAIVEPKQAGSPAVKVVEAAKEVTPEAESIAKKVTAGERVTNADTIDVGMKLKSVADLEHLANASAEIKKQIEAMRSEPDPAKKMALMNDVMRKNPQFLRESIEMATNTGSWVEGEGSVAKKYGERPLDWKKNPEVADWLRKNGERVGISLPDELKSPSKPAAELKAEAPKLKMEETRGGDLKLKPAIQTASGEIIPGKSHGEIQDGLSPEKAKGVKRGYVTPDGKFLNSLPEAVRYYEGLKSAEAQKAAEPVNNGPTISTEPLDPATGNPLSATDALVNKLETPSPAPSPTGLTGEVGKMIQREGDRVGERTSEPPAPTAGEPVTHDLGSGAETKPLTVTEKAQAQEELLALQPGEVNTAGDPRITGLAERVRTEREAAGMTAPTVPGEGIAPEASVERGRQLLPKSDPEKIMSDFEATKKLSSDDVAIARAKTEQLARATNEAHDKFGPDSKEFKAAFKTESDWAARTKAMQTEWAKTGHAQQGEVDIDTGTFTGLARAFKEDTGKDFTPEQAKTAKEKADRVKKADTEAGESKNKFYGKLTDQIGMAAQEAKSKKIASQVVRDAAVRAAKAETDARVKKAKMAVEVSKIQLAEAERATKIANKLARDNAVRSAKAEVADNVARADTAAYAWTKAREYIDSGMEDFHDIVQKIATDMGISVDKVRAALAKDKRLKTLSDDLFRKQQIARDTKTQAKLWLKSTAIPGYLRAIQSVPKILFGLKVGFHGTVALGTHAPFVAFQPPFWATYIRDFGKMYKMVGSKAYYETQINDLVRRPNYIAARRAGLVNDPFTFEDYNSPDTAKYLDKLTGMGNRGYSVLKILRQDMFDQQWNQLPRTAQMPEVAKAIADGLNHATGVVKGRAPAGSNLALFAPRLMASRVAWLAVDPVKAAMSAADWKNATPADKMFAVNQVKEKAWVAGTLFSLLAINQGFLSATDSKQKINLTDPMKSDFLKFKTAGMEFSYGNAMLSMARLPVRLYQIRQSDGGKLKNLVHPDENSYTVLGEYARSQLSPFASLASTLWFKSDWQNRPLPGSTRSVPKRLAAQGVKPYTWPEFWSEVVLPIPLEEATREVWKNGLGMNPEQIAATKKAMATIAVMSATGGRLVEDRSVEAPVPDWAK